MDQISTQFVENSAGHCIVYSMFIQIEGNESLAPHVCLQAIKLPRVYRSVLMSYHVSEDEGFISGAIKKKTSPIASHFPSRTFEMLRPFFSSSYYFL